MSADSTRPKIKEKKGSQEEQSHAWNPDQMLKALLTGQEKLENNWIGKGLPALVDTIIRKLRDFRRHGSP